MMSSDFVFLGGFGQVFGKFGLFLVVSSDQILYKVL